MMVTASKIPVPELIVPMKSTKTVNAPMHIPPNAAAVRMYRLPQPMSSKTTTTTTTLTEPPPETTNLAGTKLILTDLKGNGE
ncbi:hypothetical protein Hanom_Chr16g01442081 [Helianthus anomalus]